MSTRANVILKDGSEQLWFYRHSDGYPGGTLPALNKLMDWIKAGKIRGSLTQCAGWLIAIGMAEYGTKLICESGYLDSLEPHINWKIGAFEPTTGEHGDIEYLYTVDLEARTISYVSL